MSYIIKGRTCDYEVVIGLEVHCQVISNAKLFSGASAASGGTPNDHVAFIDAGFNLVSLATNHTMDKGEAGVIHSVNYWSSKQGIVWDGQRTSWEERDKTRIYECNGIKYAFFSYTTWTNGLERLKMISIRLKEKWILLLLRCIGGLSILWEFLMSKLKLLIICHL